MPVIGGVSYPLVSSVLMDVGMESCEFDLHRVEIYSKAASGAVFGRQLGPSIWKAAYSTTVMPNTEAVEYKGRLLRLRGILGTFEAYDVRRPYPKAYPLGDFTHSPTVSAVDGDLLFFSISGLGANFKLTTGDYMSFTIGGIKYLRSVLFDVTANASGVATNVLVEPELPPTFVTGTALNFKKPSTVMRLVPNSLRLIEQGHLNARVSFEGVGSDG